MSQLLKYSVVSRVIEVMRANRDHLPAVTPDIHVLVDRADELIGDRPLPACQIHQALWTGVGGGMIYRCQDMAVIDGRSMAQWGLSELGLRLTFAGRPPVKNEVPILHRLVERPGSTSPELSSILGVPVHVVSTRLRNLEANGMVSRDDSRPAKWAINWVNEK